MAQRKDLTEQEIAAELAFRRVMAGLLILANGIFLLCQRDMPHSWVVNAGLVITGAAFLLLPVESKMIWRLISALAVVVLTVANLPRYLDYWPDKHAWESSVHGAEQLVLALDRYNQDHQAYPLQVQELITGPYADFPENNYNPRIRCGSYDELNEEQKRELRRELSNMLPVEDSSLTTTQPLRLDAMGNFAYLPRYVEDESGELTATGFTLLVFGRRPESPVWWKDEGESAIVAYYHNSETGVTRTWK